MCDVVTHSGVSSFNYTSSRIHDGCAVVCRRVRLHFQLVEVSYSSGDLVDLAIRYMDRLLMHPLSRLDSTLAFGHGYITALSGVPYVELIQQE
jgi:hypothetical protein